MTPQEKAKELASKLYGCAHTTHVKTVAILLIDEIINSWNEDGNKRLDAPVIEYWQQVKESIEKLN